MYCIRDYIDYALGNADYLMGLKCPEQSCGKILNKDKLVSKMNSI